MALVNIEQWRAERGFPGSGGEISNAPPAPSAEAAVGPSVEELAQEIARQADLIRALQGALQEYVNREERARLAERKPATARVVRRPRKIAATPSPKPAA